MALRNNSKPKRSLKTSKNLLGLGLGIVAVAIILQLAGVVHFFPANKSNGAVPSAKDKQGSGSTPMTGSKLPTSQATSTTTTNVPKTTDQKENSNADTGILLTPSGNFVSAHMVNVNSSLSSVCNTTSGATCVIVFTASNGTVKSLSTETTDVNGSAYWNNWKPSSVGIDPGTWTIQAIAKLNGQTKSAQDAMKLTVTQ